MGVYVDEDKHVSDDKGETSQYLEENVSSDTDPEKLDKGDLSIVTRRTLLALTDENAPIFRDAFARGAIFTLNHPTQSDIDKLREILSLDREEVIPADAPDPHAEIYAITSRSDGGSMLYTYIAESSANFSNDIVLPEVESDDDSVAVPAVFTSSEDETASSDIAKRRTERFLEWSKNIDTLHEESTQSAAEARAKFESAFSKSDISGKSTRFDYDDGYIFMNPNYEVYSWHSFEDDYDHDDFYLVRISGGFGASETAQKRNTSYIFSRWFDLDSWLESDSNTDVSVWQHDPVNENRESTYTHSNGISVNGNVSFKKGEKGGETTGGGSAGINFSRSKTEKSYDYDIEDQTDKSGVSHARWLFSFNNLPKAVWDTPSKVSRGTLTPNLEAVWRVHPSYWKNHRGKYILRFRHKGEVGSTGLNYLLLGRAYAQSTYRDILLVDAPPHLAADNTDIELSADFGSSYINIMSEERCTATIFDDRWRMSSDWLGIINASRFTGNHRLMITRFKNNSYYPRTAYIVITGRETGESVTITVTQKGRGW